MSVYVKLKLFLIEYNATIRNKRKSNKLANIKIHH